MRMRWFLLTTTALVIGAAPGSALAANYSISSTSDTSQASSRCTTSGRLVCNSLRAFVLYAPSNSTAQLSAGTYSLTGGRLLFNRSGVVLAIQGSSRGTTIQQNTPGSRVVEVDGETVVLNGLKITGGNLAGGSVDAKGNGAEAGGGGIASNGLLVLELTTVTGNSVVGARGSVGQGSGAAGTGGIARGGGIENSGTLAIDDSTISGNTVTGGAGGDGPTPGPGGRGQGGGVANESGGVLVLGQGSKILDNTATGGASGSNGGQQTAAGGQGLGGGLWSEGDSYVSNDTFTGNLGQAGASQSTRSDADGGAMYADGGTLEVQASTIAGNQATTPSGTAASGGGGIATSAVTAIENSTITGNTASGSGGGLDAFAIGESVVSSTVSANSAGSGGGNLAAASGSIKLRQTIVSGGSAAAGTSNCTGAITDQGHNLESTAPSQCGLSAEGHDVIGQDPSLGPLASNGGSTQTMALQPGSPAIDAGGNCTNPNGYPLTVDQRASTRGAPCDTGAFEIRLTPSNQSAPTVSGSGRVRQLLSCNPGSWSSPDSIGYSYSWLRGGGAISGASSRTYRVTPRDAGWPLHCRVSASNDDGYSGPLTSRAAWVARTANGHAARRRR